MVEYCLKVVFYGWIPTNKGELEYSYISIPDLVKKDIKNYRKNSNEIFVYFNIDPLVDDFYVFKAFSKQRKNFVPKNAKILIKKDFTGWIEISYGKNENYFEYKSKFKIYKNGVIKFLGIETNNNISDNINTIKQIMFNLVKLFVHGDIHHHQKIDIFLPIIDSKFDPMKVAIYMTNSIKLIENTVKQNNNCESYLKNRVFMYEVEGFIAYFETFTLLFPSKKINKQLQLAKNVSYSLKSILKKREEEQKYKSYFITILITFLGLFISINILLNGFWPPQSNDIKTLLNKYSRIDAVIISFLIILFSYIIHIKCNLKSYLFYKHYKTFEVLRFIKYAQKKHLNLKGNLIKATPLILLTIGMYVLQYYLTTN